ncbi:GTPase activating protein for Arf [Blastomyces gilchristii SLH14081]|uniref:GTPase activating protein for Arf n=1 Tax=Blastomyces gilchristii (strain SLH14081) TaxID=559298 RepID=A0A179UXS4_BLAGS|nr:GTPase activating protein for Arf [Blastomyces gilchristii SLH14081]OAT11928.1 GTPase activating protein for Arf [Blastomyces gilchristii SLH14081]
MASALSKRQQARNERALQELIKSVPGNDRCVDCQARNPGWASWNLGVFLCVRCATLHRKLGTHISKVKSLSMDSWSSDQVDNMKRNGNAAVNKLYNPRNVKPPIPIDIDEVDSAMERFIRQKYELKVLEDGRPKPPSRHDPSYTVAKISDDSPPPLPPKTGRRFGFGLRSASYNNAVSSSEKSSPREDYAFSANRQSRTFGASFGDPDGTFESKLEALRDMGFPDNKRNATILKSLNGNMDKTIESLVRLGEGTDPRPRSRAPVPKVTRTSSQLSEPSKSPRSTLSNNPFDNLDYAPSRAPSSYAGSQPEPQQPSSINGAKYYNPFDSLEAQPALTQSTQSLDQSFQQLQVSQPLFPNITGGYPSQQGQMPFQRSQQSMTPPVTMSLQNGLTASPTFLNGGYNPFFQNVQPAQQTMNNNPYVDQLQGLSPTNPFFNMSGQALGSQPQTLALGRGAGNVNQTQMPQFQRYNTMPILSSSSPFSQQQQPQQQPQLQQPQQQQYIPQEQQAPYNPFTMPNAPSSNPSYQPQFNLQPPQQTLMPKQTGKIDKSSILALYNFSQPPPTIPEQSSQQLTPDFTQAQQPQQQQQQPQQNSAATFDLPASNSRNPYHTAPPNAMTTPGAPLISTVMDSKSQMGSASGGVGVVGVGRSGAGGGNPFPPRAHMSQASVDIGGMQDGRHSPDVFASLSSRYVQ